MAIFYSGLFASENVEKLSPSVAAMEQGLPSQESDAQSLYAECSNDLVAGANACIVVFTVKLPITVNSTLIKDGNEYVWLCVNYCND
jgi:hypothetical protein